MLPPLSQSKKLQLPKATQETSQVDLPTRSNSVLMK